MASLPYVSSPGNIDKALNGIKSAAVPERVSQDFVKTILKIPGGSGDQMTSFLRKLGMANSDGSASDLYKRFRNPTSSGDAVASAIKSAYAPLYVRNEFMHELSDADLLGLVVEETGQAHDAPSVRLAFSCIKHLKAFASFSASVNDNPLTLANPDEAERSSSEQPFDNRRASSLGLNLGYTINLNLPATSDPDVFDAIFKSLKEHLLRSDDA
jgi:hypothetical protein